MKLYAVRQWDDKQAVGFFWAAGLSELRYMVDSVTDVPKCEYVPIKEPCSVVWEGAAPGLGIRRKVLGDECEDWTELSRGVSFTFGFEPFVFDVVDGWQHL